MYYLLKINLNKECLKHLIACGFYISEQYGGYLVEVSQLNDILEEIYSFKGKKLVR